MKETKTQTDEFGKGLYRTKIFWNRSQYKLFNVLYDVISNQMLLILILTH